MTRPLRYLFDLLLAFCVVAAIAAGGRWVWQRMQDPCVSANGDEFRECRYLEAALYDLQHPSSENEAVLRIECEDYQRKADAYLKLPVAGVRERVRRYLDGCLFLQGGRR